MSRSAGVSRSTTPPPAQRSRRSEDMPRVSLSQRLANLMPSSSRPASPVEFVKNAASLNEPNARSHTGSSRTEPVRSGSKKHNLQQIRTKDLTTQSVDRGRRKHGNKPFSTSPLADSPKTATPTTEALHEALSEDHFFDYSRRSPIHITEPPPAQLASTAPHQSYAAMRARKQLRHPALLDHLGQSTFPSSSMAHAEPQPHISPRRPPEAASAFPFLGRSESSTRTSIEALRSLQANDKALQQLQAAHIHTNALHPRARGSTLDSLTPNIPSLWWFSHKKDVDHLLDKDDQAETAEEEGKKIRERYRSSKHPVVFCHGLLGFDSISVASTFKPVEYWRGIKEVLEANGTEVLVTRVPATSSPLERAPILAEAIDKAYHGRSVHLIGHSMGGIDCRYVASHLQGPDTFKVLSVTTVGSPHHGSIFSNYFLDTLGERLPTMLAFLDMLPMGGGDGKAFEALKVENMTKFNEETPDAPGVKYFSWGAQFSPGIFDPFWFSHGYILKHEGPNDGLVSVASSKWGKYCGTLDGVNHLDLVGWNNAAKYTWMELTGRPIGFKAATFYLRAVDSIARDVEGQEEPSESAHQASPVQTKNGKSSDTQPESPLD
ncbi:hypothetical protein FRB94_000634 [Tulasnella sp. JGI-2019a]|nr:hypothetical protein FRB93_011990 [Tulasnella sp. JGI-2019a]KAG9006540.1 hypothetical protein FRB94_000634 [Tulasnella sp. JGI-2019a]